MIMNSRSFHIITLGCAKNLVDSESISQILENKGYQRSNNRSSSKYIIINTCGFINIAKEESIKMVNKVIAQKKSGQMIIAGGCLTERYKKKALEYFPGIDAIFGTRNWMDIGKVIDLIGKSDNNHVVTYFPNIQYQHPEKLGIRHQAIQGGSAYVKIADGCRRSCAFCAIPSIKGTAKSYPIKNILQEVSYLVANNIKEVILIAQDTTDYGHDIDIKDGLSKLTDEIVSHFPLLPWLRFLYTYPGAITERLIDNMANHPQLLPYLDLPLQHAHPDILKKMSRPSNVDDVFKTILNIRNKIPDVSLRTTFIVGFPGETENEFKTLLDFIEEVKFDHLGAFKFSFEKGVPGEIYGDPVPEEEKACRLNRIMQVQEKITLSKNKIFVNTIMNVLIEGSNDGIIVGRTYRDAPEIDGLVIATGNGNIGDIVPVLINDSTVHDLYGIAIPQ